MIHQPYSHYWLYLLPLKFLKMFLLCSASSAYLCWFPGPNSAFSLIKWLHKYILAYLHLLFKSKHFLIQCLQLYWYIYNLYSYIDRYTTSTYTDADLHTQQQLYWYIYNLYSYIDTYTTSTYTDADLHTQQQCT